jgi:outer membrane lipoprotein-sorting protein
MNEQDKIDVLSRRAAEAISDDRDLWPEILNQIDPKSIRRSVDGDRGRPRGWWKRPIVGVATAAALVVAIGVSSPLWSQPQPASAQAILDRAEATVNDASVAVTTYHLRLTRHVPAKQNATLSVEMWYGGKDRQRSDQTVVDGTGATASIDEVVFNGAQTWIAETRGGMTQVIHTTGTTWTQPVEDPTKLTSLADVLRQYAGDRTCLRADKNGEDTVANRATYVIALHSDPTLCATKGGSVAGGSSGKVGQPNLSDSSVAQMTVWVDKQSFLPLRTEVRNASGTLLDSSEVTSVEYNTAIPDATFTYTPPSGATVRNFTGGNGADVKRAMFEGQSPAPAKSPKP